MMLTLLAYHHTRHIPWRRREGLLPLPVVMRENGYRHCFAQTWFTQAFSHLWVKKEKQCPACGSHNLLDHKLLGLSGLSDFLRVHTLLTVFPFSQLQQALEYFQSILSWWNVQTSTSGRAQCCMDHHQSQNVGKACVSSLCFFICVQISTFTHATWLVLGIQSSSDPKKYQMPKANQKGWVC